MASNKLTQNLIDDIKPLYPAGVRDALQALFGYMQTYCGGDRKRLSAKLKQLGCDFSDNYLYKFFSGRLIDKKDRFIGSVESFVAAAEAIKAAEAGRLAGGRLPPTETDVMRMIRDACDTIRQPGRVCKTLYVSGSTARQKSYCFEWYALEVNHGTTKYMDAPCTHDLGMFIFQLAKLAGKSYLRTRYERIDHILSNLNESHLVIIDNAQRLYNPRSGNTQDCFSLLQQIQDATRCALALIFVKDTFVNERGLQDETDWLAEILSGPAKGFFTQQIGRIGGEENILRLPDASSDADLAAFARSAGFTAPEDVRAILPVLRHLDRRAGGLRIALQQLQEAAGRAAAAGEDATRPQHLLRHIPTDALDDRQRDKLLTLIAEAEAPKLTTGKASGQPWEKPQIEAQMKELHTVNGGGES